MAAKATHIYRLSQFKRKKIGRDPLFKILIDPKRIFRWIIRKIKKKLR